MSKSWFGKVFQISILNSKLILVLCLLQMFAHAHVCVYVQGALEELLEKCNHVQDGDMHVAMAEKHRSAITVMGLHYNSQVSDLCSRYRR